MKKYFIALILTAFGYVSSAVAQTKISGIIKDENNKPLPAASITNKTNNKRTLTNNDGKFEIEAKINDTLLINYVGFNSAQIVLQTLDDLDIKLNANESLSDVVVVSSFSPKSYWLGATIGYNIDGAEIDNVVGSAKMSINPVKGKYLRADWGIVGNFSNFISAQNKEQMSKDLLKLSQGTQGLSISIAGNWDILTGNEDIDFRIFLLTGYRLNAFQKVGKDSVSVGLSQIRNSMGFEVEGLEFKHGGKLHISVEGSISFFDESKYEIIFSNKRKSLSTLEASIVLPIASNIGFLVNGTYNKRFSPVYQFGIIFKDLR